MQRSSWLLGLFLWISGDSVRADSNSQIQALQEKIHQIIAKAEPSIACIAVSRSDRYKDFRAAPSVDQPGKLGDFFPRRGFPFGAEDGLQRDLARRLDLSDPDNIPDSFGSGVVIDPSGLILTNYHVIKEATKVYIRLCDGNESYADIYAADERCDLAVLKMQQVKGGLKPISYGEGEKARKGDWIISMANPFAVGFRDGSPSASWGILSNLRRRAIGPPREIERNKPLTNYSILMQTDARLNLGCSGGALLNLDGKMIGLTTSLVALNGGESAGGFAMPVDANLVRIINTLKDGREVEYGFLGISLLPDNATTDGLMIKEATPGLPAQRAGLGSNDVIKEINGTPIRNFDDLFLTIGAQLAGTEVRLQVQSYTGTREVRLRLAKVNNPFKFIASKRPASIHGLRIDYNSLLPNDPQSGLPAGVWVRELEKGSAAESKFKPRTDGSAMIITAVNGQAITSPSEFYQEVKKARGSIEFRVVDVVRTSESTTRTITLP